MNNEIEWQDIIGEANEGSYRPIRFTRIKYSNNPNVLIDVRRFQRGYDEEGEEAFYPTKVGFQFLESEFKKVVGKWTIMPAAYVHPSVIDRSFDLLSKGQFESAVVQAFKCIENEIREKTKFKDDYGVSLIRRAFDAHKGPLTDMNKPTAEREAFAHFVAGAYGVFRNPCSHRDVKMNLYEAYEQVVVASMILKTIERMCDNKALGENFEQLRSPKSSS